MFVREILAEESIEARKTEMDSSLDGESERIDKGSVGFFLTSFGNR